MESKAMVAIGALTGSASVDAALAGKDPVASIAGQITALSTGDRALLRRLYLTRSSSSRGRQADGVVVGLLHRAGITMPIQMTAYEPWRLLAHVAALLSGTGGEQPHSKAVRVGRALYAAGYSENRLLRLTAMRGDGLADQIVRAARLLAQAGTGPVNLWTMLNLAGRDSKHAEEARVRIAQDYYAADAASK